MANSGDPEVEEASEPSDSEEETRAPSPDQHQQDGLSDCVAIVSYLSVGVASIMVN